MSSKRRGRPTGHHGSVPAGCYPASHFKRFLAKHTSRLYPSRLSSSLKYGMAIGLGPEPDHVHVIGGGTRCLYWRQETVFTWADTMGLAVLDPVTLQPVAAGGTGAA